MCAVTEPLTALSESNETLSQRVQEFLCSRFVFLLWSGPSIQGFFFFIYFFIWQSRGRDEEVKMDGSVEANEKRNLPPTGRTEN